MRTLGRMRGQVLDRVRSTQGSFAACGRRALRAHRTATLPPLSLHDISPRQGESAPGPPLRELSLWPGIGFPARKSGVLGCNSFWPHWGPESAKFRTFAVQDLRLALPNQRYRCESWREAQGPPLRKTKTVTFYRIYRRGGAEGESAEGREKPPWGVPLPPVSRNPPQGRRTGPPAPLAGGG